MKILLLTLAFMLLDSVIMTVVHPAVRSAICYVFRRPPRSLWTVFALELLNMFFVLCAVLEANMFLMKLFELWK